MPLANTQSQVTYAGNGVTTDFPTTFAFLGEADLLVEQRTGAGAWSTKVRGVDYTVDGAGDAEPGGTVEMTVAPPIGDQLRITRNTPQTQAAELQTSGPLPSRTIIQAADKLTMEVQELDRRVDSLEAGTASVTLNASKVQDTFVVAEPVENSFPRNVACVGTPSMVLIGLVEDLTDPALSQYGLGLPDISARAVNQFTVRHIPGLTPGHNTRITYLVLTI